MSKAIEVLQHRREVDARTDDLLRHAQCVTYHLASFSPEYCPRIKDTIYELIDLLIPDYEPGGNARNDER